MIGHHVQVLRDQFTLSNVHFETEEGTEYFCLQVIKVKSITAIANKCKEMY